MTTVRHRSNFEKSKNFKKSIVCVTKRRRETQHDNTQDNDTYHNRLTCDSQHQWHSENDTDHNLRVLLS